jgi:hemerythrin superfamily protein
MPTGTTPQPGAAPRRATRARGQDATELLMSDHREVETLFSDYQRAAGDAQKGAIAGKICQALKVHTQIEEELFYPAAQDCLSQKDEKLVEEAIVEHAGAKQVIAEIEAMSPGDPACDGKVKVLKQQIEHHVKEEETELFPKVRRTDADLMSLGSRMAERKRELMARMMRDGDRS